MREFYFRNLKLGSYDSNLIINVQCKNVSCSYAFCESNWEVPVFPLVAFEASQSSRISLLC